MLRAYALLIGAGLIVLGLTGFSVVPSDVLTFPENALHLAVGLIFCSGVLLLGTDAGNLRRFVGAWRACCFWAREPASRRAGQAWGSSTSACSAAAVWWQERRA